MCLSTHSIHRTRPAASYATKLGNQACPLAGLAALHERGRDKGPVVYRILLRTNMRGSMTSLLFSHTHEKDWLGADAMYFRIKKPWKCRCALSDRWRGVVES